MNPALLTNASAAARAGPSPSLHPTFADNARIKAVAADMLVTGTIRSAAVSPRNGMTAFARMQVPAEATLFEPLSALRAGSGCS
jgi:hypothetical protein